MSKVGNNLTWDFLRKAEAVIIELFLIYMMFITLLVCPEGYVQYDLYKRNIFFVGAICFVVVAGVAALIVLIGRDTKRASAKIDVKALCLGKIDLLLLGTLIIWAIGIAISQNPHDAFWGDSFREIGFLYLGLGLVGMWIISKYVKWNAILTWALMISTGIVYMGQILMYYWVDPLNWTFDGQYASLMSTLANLNHNACFDVLMASVGIFLLFMSKKKSSVIVYTVYLFLNFMGGIACSSTTFYIGMFIVMLLTLLFALVYDGMLWRGWLTLAAMFAAIVLHKLITSVAPNGTVGGEAITSILMNGAFILVYAVVLVLLALMNWKCSSLIQGKRKLFAGIYVVFVLAVVATLAAFLLAANAGKITGSLAGIADAIASQGTSGRDGIWKVTVGMFAQLPIGNKLLGIGLNNYSTVIYHYYPNELAQMFPGMVLADAHNVYLDLLASSGILGCICYFGMIAGILVKSIQLARKSPAGILGILAVAGYVGYSMANSNLIISTQFFFLVMALCWKLANTYRVSETVLPVEVSDF